MEPLDPLPTVDAFNRTENPLSDGGLWANGINSTTGVETGLSRPRTRSHARRRRPAPPGASQPSTEPDVEVWTTISTLPGAGNAVRLYARLRDVGTGTYDGYMLRTNQLSGTDQVFLERIDNGAIVSRLTVNQELAAGDIVLLRAKGSSLELWRNAGSAWSRLGVVTDSTYTAAGYAGIGLRGTTGRLDDFGARSPTQGPPHAPTGLGAVGGASSVSLSWTAPAFDGGSPVTNYKVYRGASAGAESFHADAGSSTTYVDAGAVNGTTYYYKVSAENLNGEGQLWKQSAATPTAAVPPVVPLADSRLLRPA